MKSAANFDHKELNKLRLVFEQTPGAIFILDREFRFEYVNPGYEKLSGFSKSELLGKSVGEIFSQTDYTEPRKEIIQSMLAGEKWEGEMQTYKKDGSTYWATTVSSPFWEDDGTLEGYIIIQQDVTDRKVIEQSLRESENLYRSLIENSMNAVALNQDEKFILVNSAFCKTMGYSHEEIFSMNPTSIVAPHDFERVMNIHRRRMEGEFESINYTAHFVHKTGRLILAELNATTIQLNGRNASYVSLRDITQKNRLEQELKKSEQKYRELTEMLPIGVYELNLQGQIQYINQAGKKLFNFDSRLDSTASAMSLFTKSDSDFMTQNLKNEIERLRSLNFETEQEEVPIPVEFTAKRANGEEFQVLVYLNYILDDGKVTGFRGIIIDISERKAIENALRESEEKYKTLVENSHDGIIIVRHGKVLYANDTICNMLDYCLEGKMLLSENIVHPEDQNKMLEIAEKRKNGDISTINIIVRLIAKDGSVKVCYTTSTMIKFEGEWAAFYTVHDTTEKNRIQYELIESEKKYRQLTEMLPLTVYELDANNKPTYINKAGRELFGLNSENSGNNAMSFFVSGDRERMKDVLKNENHNAQNLAHNANPNPSDPAEYTVQKPDGTNIPVLIYGTAIVENGKPVGSRGVILDISERKAMENALRESEEKYKTLIENSQDGIFAIIEDKMLFANTTFCKMVGYTPEELYNKSAISLVHPDDRARGLAISELRKQGNHSTINDIFRFVAKDGSIKEGDVFSSVMDLNGQIVSYITVHDLTETRRIQEQLIKSEQKYRELAEMLPQTVYELDLNANLKYLNKTGREKFGTAYETADVSVFSIVVPDQLERMKQNFTNVSFNNISSKGNFYKLRQVDGQIFEAMISATPMMMDGKTIGSRGVVIDITDHVKMQNALRDSEEKYRTLIENATDGIVIVQNGLLKFANQTMCDIMKYSMEELMNKPFLDYIDVTEHESLNQFHLRRMQGEQFSNILRSQFIRKDGKMITVELNARTSNYNGAPAGFIVIRDITDRLKIETELQYAKTELEKLNSQLEKRVKESSKRLTEARTQLINLQKENLQSQYDVLKQQVNPHFLFNSLNVLTSLIKLEPDLAEKFSEQLSKVYRYVLENKDNELVDLNTELNFLDAYIFLLNIRFVGKLILNLHIPIENRGDKIIPLAMQLLIENAIKHNVMSKSTPLIIDIFIDESNCLNVINNLQERPSQIVSTGVGLKNILNRYKLLNLTAPIFEKTDTQFKARIQLVKN